MEKDSSTWCGQVNHDISIDLCITIEEFNFTQVLEITVWCHMVYNTFSSFKLDLTQY